ncbi:hypothetical protein SLEP1_g23282 [Rubroshorea leprosula]|uniref:Uncharacterized protein n=2 Tax=Rubroshorea leprosula TaxID=152421 RepID=A0AAV5JLD9_9ROSI|nr:hypothetical protein SLEP1_g23282 [Rubroshorea leprosula]
MRPSFSQLGNALPVPKLFRQLGQEMETVISVLQPGPLGSLSTSSLVRKFVRQMQLFEELLRIGEGMQA